jgi:hypothetical protein
LLPKRTGAALVLAIALSGCGGEPRATATATATRPPGTRPPRTRPQAARRGGEFAGLPPDQRPFPAGRGPRFHPPATSIAVQARRPVDEMRCERSGTPVFAAHLELYAGRLVFPVPAGIGVAPPLQRSGAYVLGGACTYPLRTVEPTGIVLVARRRRHPTLGDLFDLWGEPLTRTRLAGFRGRVGAFVGGRRRRGDPRTIALTPHAEIVLEIAGFVLPHGRYLFPAITNLLRR